MSSTTVITDAAGIATAIGVLFGAVQLLLSRTQTRTSFEDAVAAQYRQTIKPAITDALLTSLAQDEREAVRPFYEYFDLSNEQVFLRTQGRVRRKTWDEWAEGIKSNLAREPIRSAWHAARDRLSEFNELRLMDQSGFDRDPRTWNPRWRRLLHCELPSSDPRIVRRVTGRDPDLARTCQQAIQRRCPESAAHRRA